MGRIKLPPLYPTDLIAWEELAPGVKRWTLDSDRGFVYADGMLSVFDGQVYQPLAEVESWQSAIQFSRGFDAGRELKSLPCEIDLRGIL